MDFDAAHEAEGVMRIRNYRNCHTHAYAINARGAALMLQKAQPPPDPRKAKTKTNTKKVSSVRRGLATSDQHRVEWVSCVLVKRLSINTKTCCKYS